MILVITLLILLCLLILAVAAIVIFYIQNPIEEEGKGKAQDNIKQLTTPTTTNPTKTQPNINDTLFLKFSKYNKDGEEIFNYLQEIITEFQKEGCAHIMATFDLEKFSKDIRQIYKENGVTCIEAKQMLKDMIIADTSDNIYYGKTIKLVEILIEKIVDMTCLNGEIDVDKIINLMLIMKNTLCGIN